MVSFGESGAHVKGVDNGRQVDSDVSNADPHHPLLARPQMTLDPGWTRTVDDGISNAAWDDYDTLIQAEVTDYNKRLATTPGFLKIDWKQFKAVVWVESGGPSSTAWTARAMQ